MKVDYKDRDDRLAIIDVALRAVGLRVDYQTTDLIVTTLESLEKSKGKMDLREASEIAVEWEKKWDAYFEKKKYIGLSED